MKIQIVGYAASGKSTFAKKLQTHYQLPLLHIDTIFFSPNWVERNKTSVEQEIRVFMQQDRWIIDGLYRRLATERFDACDQLFIFDFNRFKCLYGAIARRFKYHKQQRDSIAKGCKEKLDFGFLWWILFSGRKKNSRNLIKRYKMDYKDKVVVFKNRRQIDRYLKSIDYKKSENSG
ncbi:MAG: DNA topology modulation protein FlaR [Acholeplasmataceae bacterium]|nr:DNA topology modulation protein FlaR [Acholeplasmataceae bacterium]